MMTLYDFMGSGNGYKVRLVLAHLGLPYKLVERDILKGETRTPEFLTRTPNGRIPTLQLDDGSHLFESNAIIWYLAEATKLAPADRRARAETLQWMFFEQYSHEPNIATARFVMHFVPPDDERRQGLPGMTKRGYKALDVMEGHLKARSHFVADRYSIADIATYPWVARYEWHKTRLDDFPDVKRWFEAISARPAVERGMKVPG